MFSYFGSKSKLVGHYPKPKFKKIYEPFCGSARYSLLYWQNEVTIIDANPRITNLWKYLQEASVDDIMGLPTLEWGQTLNKFPSLTQEEQDLIGYELCRGKSTPRRTVNRFSDWARAKVRIASNLHKIRHWEIINGSYLDEVDTSQEDTTYFIDPPYILKKDLSNRYPYGDNKIDYVQLANWCKSLKGQVIVCAGTYDDWLPFRNLLEVNNFGKANIEKIWTNDL